MRLMKMGGRPAGNLPPEMTSLVGRRGELARIRRLCREFRMVTLTGAAGVGKTRLALRAAARMRPAYADGAWYIPLSALDQGALLPYTIAEALPLADRTTRPMMEVLGEYLADRHLLLVLDTCEHLIDDCARTARALLVAAPRLTILATSRRPLDVPDEQALIIEPLPVPDARGEGPQEAVKLLAERAAAVVPGFEVTDGNRHQLVRICRHLEGLPLAIELAAARLPQAGRRRAVRAARRPLRAAGRRRRRSAGSRPALAPGAAHRDRVEPPAVRSGERLLWARASVFAGSFDDRAVIEVCADRLLPADAIPGLLAGLVDKSILIWAPPRAAASATGCWTRSASTAPAGCAPSASRTSCAAATATTTWRWPARATPPGSAPTRSPGTTAPPPSTRTCASPSTSACPPPGDHGALELAAALWFFWYPCGFLREGQHYLERALELDTEASAVRSRALWVCALTLIVQGDADAGMAWATECAGVAEELGDAPAALAAQAMVMAAATIRGDLPLALALADSLVAVHRPEQGLDLPTMLARLGQCHVHTAQGRIEDAIRALEELCAECDEHGERWMRAYADLFRAQAELALGRYEPAQRYARASLELKHRLHDSIGIALALDVLACAAAASGQGEPAARLLGLAQQVWDTIGRAQIGIHEWVEARTRCERQARAAIGDQAYGTAFRTGYDTGLDTGIVQAIDSGTAHR
ncbi:hypothetical protein [Nonomuraea salmonea]|uniref:ATP-binding protein n=1 Tax=Nonomuraea salmonea TaxID=46181 RepID=UPI0031E84FF0